MMNLSVCQVTWLPWGPRNTTTPLSSRAGRCRTRHNLTIRVAVYDEPLQGKDTAAFLFGVLTRELTPFELSGEIVEGNTTVVWFKTSLGGQRAEGLNVVTCQPGGLVGELTVFFGPLAALSLIAEVIGGHMERRFGPREVSP